MRVHKVTQLSKRILSLCLLGIVGAAILWMMKYHHCGNLKCYIETTVTLSLVVPLRLREKCAWWHHRIVWNWDPSMRPSPSLMQKKWMEAIKDEMESMRTRQLWNLMDTWWIYLLDARLLRTSEFLKSSERQIDLLRGIRNDSWRKGTPGKRW